MKGPGRLFIFNPASHHPETVLDTADALFDVAWSELDPNQLVGACANGQIILWNTDRARTTPPVMWKGHQKEVNSVDWNLVSKSLFLSSSWDHTIQLWDPTKGALNRFVEHSQSVYQAGWSPRDAFVFISVSGDRSIKLWDIRTPTSQRTISNGHEHEILSFDWNKYDPNQFATSSVDLNIKIWDWRMTHSQPVHKLPGHYRAIRRVKYSPFSPTELVSVGYDMTVRWWNLTNLNPLESIYDAHTEFVTGIDFSLEKPGLLASCSWDESVHFLSNRMPQLNT